MTHNAYTCVYTYTYTLYKSCAYNLCIGKTCPFALESAIGKNTSIGNRHFSDLKRHFQWLKRHFSDLKRHFQWLKRRFPMEVKLPIAFSNAREPDFPMSESWPVCKHRIYITYTYTHTYIHIYVYVYIYIYIHMRRHMYACS